MSQVHTAAGALTGSFFSSVVRDTFRREVDCAKKSGESPWLVIAKHERFYNLGAVVVARCVAALVRRAVRVCGGPGEARCNVPWDGETTEVGDDDDDHWARMMAGDEDESPPGSAEADGADAG